MCKRNNKEQEGIGARTQLVGLLNAVAVISIRAQSAWKPPGAPIMPPGRAGAIGFIMIGFETLSSSLRYESNSSLVADYLSAISKISLNLAFVLKALFDESRQQEDLGEVITLQRAILELWPTGHPEWFTSLNNLASFKGRGDHSLSHCPWNSCRIVIPNVLRLTPQRCR